MSPEALALDVRATIAVWILEGLSFADMCAALEILPLPVSDPIRYVEFSMYAIALAAEGEAA